MTVPFLDLRRLSRVIAPLVAAEWQRCAERADFIEGEHVACFEGDISLVTRAPNVIACANGTDALVLALMAAGIGHGDLVAIPALTFWATYEAVRAVGAEAVVVDIDPDDLQMSLAALDAAQPFKAAILVHLFGWASAQLADIREWCAAYDVRLIEDGAQAFGLPVFESADIATLSFYPSKVLGGCSDGGAVTCRNPDDAALIRQLRNHGRTSGYEHARAGVNSRMSAMNAAYLRVALGLIDRIVAERRATLSQYAAELPSELKMWGANESNGYLAVVTSDRRSGEELADALAMAGVGWARTYPKTIADQPGFYGNVEDIPNARAFCERVVNLPCFYGMTADEHGQVVEALR